MDNKEIISLLDELRIKADILIQYAFRYKVSPETTLAWRSLQIAKCWLGKLKSEFGSETPYTVASQAKDIPPTAEVYAGELEVSQGHLADVNSMRQKIQDFHDEIWKDWQLTGHLYLNHVCQHLFEARFWYGFELQRLREQNIKTNEVITSQKAS